MVMAPEPPLTASAILLVAPEEREIDPPRFSAVEAPEAALGPTKSPAERVTSPPEPLLPYPTDREMEPDLPTLVAEGITSPAVPVEIATFPEEPPIVLPIVLPDAISMSPEPSRGSGVAPAVLVTSRLADLSETFPVFLRAP
jgi:hypothetical protein